MITAEKIRIYDTYRGESDGMSRVGRAWEYDLFEEGEWAAIDKMYQDLNLINKRHTAVSYTDEAIKNIWRQCDYASAKNLVQKLFLYEDFQMLVGLLHMLKRSAHTENTVWVGFNSEKEFLAEIDYFRERLRFCDFVILEQVGANFGPSGTYLEIFLSINQEKLFHNFKKDFDRFYQSIIGRANA